MRWLPARAHDNGMFLIFSNGVGVDDDEIRTGNAAIFDPYGTILAETCKAGDDMVIADLNKSARVNTVASGNVASRRPSLYAKISEPIEEASTRDIRNSLTGHTIK